MSSSPSASDLLDSLAKSGEIEISVEQAMASHGKPGVTFLDGTWFMPNAPTSGRLQFEAGPRISGAQFYDIDDISSKGEDLNPKILPHMFPPVPLLEAAMDALDIGSQGTVIVYGQAACPFVYRAWYQLWSMRNADQNVFVLRGSLQDWIEAGGPVDTEPTTVSLAAKDLDLTQPRKYKATKPSAKVVDFEELQQIVSLDEAARNDIVLDARPADRFLGEVEEPRPGLRKGHMPGAQNLPFLQVLEPDNRNQLQSKAALEQLLAPYNDKRVVVSCGSGVTACAVAAALIKSGRGGDSVAVYDGSWVEWGSDANVPIVTGKSEKDGDDDESPTKKQKTE